jgi:hypothetical protein
MRHPPESRWQQKVFEDVLKERRYQDRQWGQEVDDTLKRHGCGARISVAMRPSGCKTHIAGREKTPKNFTIG